MKTRVIHTKFWTDSYIRSLTQTEKFFYFYLISNEFINVLHIYELPTDIASYQTKIPMEEITQAKNKFMVDGKIDCKNEWIYLKNADKYSYYKGIKNNQRKLRIMIEMSEEIFNYFSKPLEQVIKAIISETDLNEVKDKDFITLLNRVIHRGIDRGMGILLINQKSKNENQKLEKKEDIKDFKFEGNIAIPVGGKN